MADFLLSDSDEYSEDEEQLLQVHRQKTVSSRLEIFKSQDLEKGRFDVTFEIDGKKLHANQFILTSASETLDVWLTDRWTKKDEVVKIESYSYDNFYQFLCFLYSDQCDLTPENIFQIVDMAEFYAVPFLKDLCDRFLSSMNRITIENIEEMHEFAEKYSLERFMHSIGRYIYHNIDDILNGLNFADLKKSLIHFMATVFEQHGDYEEKFFTAVYKWAEHEVQKQRVADDETFNLEEAIKAELETILPYIKFHKMDFDFLMSFVLPKGFRLSPSKLLKFYKTFEIRCKDDQRLFKSVYELAEKQTLKKQEMTDDEEFNVVESVKADLVKVIPQVKLYRMKKEFLTDFVVAKGVLSEEEARNVYNTRVEIQNGRHEISGVFMDDYYIRRAFDNDESRTTKKTKFNKLRYYKIKIPIPSTPSTVTKMKGIEWYICLEKDGVFTLKHHSLVGRSDYLIAQMEGDDEFELSRLNNTHFKFSDNV